ncbi:MAG: BolA family transcriptional regulator [Gammaproteobacteria bacterium]|nr:BolA family transcriptional regulator [Gammaproteobacteria bacterium]MCH9744169.1 BolA family transcriptional regulator [Gammaproteobacteria bacterium]
MTAEEVAAAIKERLTDAFRPRLLELIDETHKHYKHAGYQPGKYHFKLTISSDCFADIKTLEQHRMIYAALGDLMQTSIHALRIAVVD